MKSARLVVLLAGLLAVTGCHNTWRGAKTDTRRAVHKTGEGVEKAGKKIEHAGDKK
jgi:predicted small secreted protein